MESFDRTGEVKLPVVSKPQIAFAGKAQETNAAIGR